MSYTPLQSQPKLKNSLSLLTLALIVGVLGAVFATIIGIGNVIIYSEFMSRFVVSDRTSRYLLFSIPVGYSIFTGSVAPNCLACIVLIIFIKHKVILWGKMSPHLKAIVVLINGSAVFIFGQLAVIYLVFGWEKVVHIFTGAPIFYFCSLPATLLSSYFVIRLLVFWTPKVGNYK